MFYLKTIDINLLTLLFVEWSLSNFPYNWTIGFPFHLFSSVTSNMDELNGGNSKPEIVKTESGSSAAMVTAVVVGLMLVQFVGSQCYVLFSPEAVSSTQFSSSSLVQFVNIFQKCKL